ncbi:electron transport complex protein RnfC [Hydrogenispora ethanolica]|jgi:electron transport complex protein RnfC|uniref:Ion-translocating oxidoreductase complex subunit C n=1 Tax=Hydrogenispora ethanolica TaxID=1082276 RepID=A0A4R1S2P8_HYDET|nr:electron transport complex subunit RsxC [Hydrogenispora ethanolica]TCL73174.1 electron transport complex protein RnfC [Hydrogenispora ethanolica]
MNKHHFRGGIHPPEHKNTPGAAIENLPPGGTVVLPLSQHLGAPARPLVAPGDRVRTGQLIAEAAGRVSANIHASVTGKVIALEARPHPNGQNAPAIVIAAEDPDDPVPFTPHQPDELSDAELLELIQQAGIVGLGGAAFPTHVKLAPPQEQRVDTLIVNACECEPYLTCDHRVLLEESAAVLGGVRIAMRLLRAETAYIGIEDNKPDAIAHWQQLLAGQSRIKLVGLRTKYPQGSEKQLIQALTRRTVPSGKLPLDVGCVVQNVQTLKAIDDAVRLGKPLYERVLTVTGRVNRPANLRVRLGTPLAAVIEHCGGFSSETVQKVIAGGPMMGIAQWTLEVPVVKGTSGVLVLAAEDARTQPTTHCIRCGKCVNACVMGLIPTQISRLVDKEMVEELKDYHPLDCLECGCCAYLCPAKLPLLQQLKLAKAMLRKNKN